MSYFNASVIEILLAISYFARTCYEIFCSKVYHRELVAKICWQGTVFQVVVFLTASFSFSILLQQMFGGSVHPECDLWVCPISNML